MERHFSHLSLDDLKQLATHLAAQLDRQDVVALTGTLGVGKTAFSRFLIQALTDDTMDVTSPTFSIVQPYSSATTDIFHFDLYRLNSIDEAYECGIEDALYDGITLIEWPEIINNILPSQTLYISLSFSDDENNRDVTITTNKTTLEL